MPLVQTLNKISGKYGSFLLTGTSVITVPASVEINALVADQEGAIITTIRLVDKDGAEFKYRDSTGTFDWDGKEIGPGTIIDIPEGYKLKSIQLTSGYLKGICRSQPILTAV